MTDELLNWRQEFPILDKTTYLVTHSLGAMPRRALGRLEEYGKTWADRGVRAWHEGWWEIPVACGNVLGRIFNAPKDTVVMHQNVSIAMGMILSCFDWAREERKKILSNTEEFHTVLYACEEQARLGAVHESVEKDALLDAIGGQVKLVVLSLVFFRNAAVPDVAAVVKKAHEHGALVVLDAYQGIGTVPFDVQAIPVDFMVGGSVKWLCGGPGAAYLYVNPKHIEKLEPKLTGWAAHERPFAFERGRVKYAHSIWRFLNGTPSVPALYAARSGHEIIHEVGVEKIREKSLRQTQLIMDLADARGFQVVTPRAPDSRGGSVTVDMPHGEAIVPALEEKDILVDYRPGSGVRVSPHFYTRDDELKMAFEEIDRLLETKAYEKFSGMAARH